jgi:hypothetical protein
MYVEVPPLNDVVVERVDDWPLSIVDGLADMIGAVRDGFTVTVTVIVAVPPRESVTSTQ